MCLILINFWYIPIRSHILILLLLMLSELAVFIKSFHSPWIIENINILRIASCYIYCLLTFSLLESNFMMSTILFGNTEKGMDQIRTAVKHGRMYRVIFNLQLACKTIPLASQEMTLSATRSPMTLLNISRC